MIWQLRLTEADAMLEKHCGKHPFTAALYVLSGFWNAICTEEKPAEEEALRRVGLSCDNYMSYYFKAILQQMVQPLCNGYKQKLVASGFSAIYKWTANAGKPPAKMYTPAEVQHFGLNFTTKDGRNVRKCASNAYHGHGKHFMCVVYLTFTGALF